MHDTTNAAGLAKYVAFGLRCLNCLGVVYGDIGTSPLYVFKSIFNPQFPALEADVKGICCLIFWSVTLVVTVKYLIFILMADFKGEGGTFALLSLILYDPNTDEDLELRKYGNKNFSSGSKGEVRLPNENADVELPRMSTDIPIRVSTSGSADEAPRVSFEEPPSPRYDVNLDTNEIREHRARAMSVDANGRPSVDNPFKHISEHTSLQKLRKSRLLRNTSVKSFVSVSAIVASSLLLGDGVITPAISVISAVEGLELVSPKLSVAIVPIAVAILLILFWSQRFGTAKIGRVFGPIMVLWFLSIFLIGIYRISFAPRIFEALNPVEGYQYFRRNGYKGWALLGSVVLCVTGGEAMFADMGHFGKWPVRISWLSVVYPSVLMNYFGQGAHLLGSPEDIDDPFFHSVPDALFWPLLILSMLATVIASQALISGSFSVMQQAIKMKLFPEIEIVHTSSSTEGQIYIPFLNYVLGFTCIILVVSFQSSERLGALYGLAVCGDMTFTTLFFAILTRLRWRWMFLPWILLITQFLVVDLSFLSAALLKIPEGAWFTIAFSFLVFLIMYNWRWGKIAIKKKILEQQMSLGTLMKAADSQHLKRFDRIGVYLSDVPHGVPGSLIELVEHSPFLQSTVVFITIKHLHVPVVPKRYREKIIPLKLAGCYRVIAFTGYKENYISIPQLLEECAEKIPELQYKKASFFVGDHHIVVNPQYNVFKRTFINMFSVMRSLTYGTKREYQLPTSQTVIVGQDLII